MKARQSKQEPVGAIGKRKPPSISLERKATTESKKSSPRSRIPSQSVTPPTIFDEMPSTASESILASQEDTWQIDNWQTEAFSIDPLSHAELAPFSLDVSADWCSSIASRDSDSSRSEFSHTAYTSHASLDTTTNMEFEFDMDESTFMSSLFPSDTPSLEASPDNLDFLSGRQYPANGGTGDGSNGQPF